MHQQPERKDSTISSPSEASQVSSEVPTKHCVNQPSRGNTKLPSLRWSQTPSTVNFSAVFSDLEPNELQNSIQVEIKEDRLSCSCCSYAFQLTFPHNILPDLSKWTVKESTTTVKFALAKVSKRRLEDWWVKLCTEKIPTLGVDWSNWREPSEEIETSADEDSHTGVESNAVSMDFSSMPEDTLNSEDTKRLLVTHIPFSEADATPLDDAPDLLTDGWLSYFSDKMTTPQRMFTLVEVWNNCDAEDRTVLMKTMVELTPTDISKLVKGGVENLQSFDPYRYIEEGVGVCDAWVKQFTLLDRETRLQCISVLFNNLPEFDRRLVLSTFM